MRDRVKGVGGGSLGSSVPLHVTSHPPHPWDREGARRARLRWFTGHGEDGIPGKRTGRGEKRLEQRGNRSETRPILTHLGWFLSSFVRLRLTHSSLTSPSARERLRRRTERGSREAGTGGEG